MCFVDEFYQNNFTNVDVLTLLHFIVYNITDCTFRDHIIFFNDSTVSFDYNVNTDEE